MGVSAAYSSALAFPCELLMPRVSMNSRRRPAVIIPCLALIEALIWYGLGAGFLLAYSAMQPVETKAVVTHFSLLTIFCGYVACTRFTVWPLVPGRRGAAVLNALTVTVVLTGLIAYYTVVLVGLRSWGRVVTWRLIETYIGDSASLLQALGISPIIAYGGAALLLLGVGSALAWALVRVDWTYDLSQRLSLPTVAICSLACFSILTVHLLVFIAEPRARDGEPFSLTFFPEQATHARQSHTWGNARIRETAEDNVRRHYVPAADAVRRNVILIVGDALRPDHMSAYGYRRPTTPHIDALLRSAHLTRVERMVGVCAESSCGLMGINRSKYVHELTDRDLSLQEVLHRHGYRVHLILSGDHTNFYGLRESYGPVDSYFDGASARGRYMNDDELIFDGVASLPTWDGQPVMLQFHLMSTHGLGTRHHASQRFQPASNYYKVGAVHATGSPEPADEAVNFYDNGVLQFDSMVDRLIKGLKFKGYLDDAIVVITADHGELLGEYGLFGHASTVHEQVLRVPFLLLSFGRVLAHRIDTTGLSSQLDIAPTLLSAMRMPIPPTWSGRTLTEASHRAFVRFQQGSLVGLFDLRSHERIWKYSLDLGTGKEFAVDATAGVDESRNQITEVEAELRGEWKRLVMEAGSAVVLREECCAAGAMLR